MRKLRSTAVLAALTITAWGIAPTQALGLGSSASAIVQEVPAPSASVLSMWIPWDDTIYSSRTTCMSRGSFIGRTYHLQYRCLERWTVNVQPPRYGWMLEVLDVS